MDFKELLETDAEELKYIFREKKDEYIYLDVKKETEKPYLTEGWEIFKEQKRTTKLRKLKSPDVYLEDRMWCVLYKMGFDGLNIDRNFKIPISERENVNPKQIDVFAIDENVVLIVECKYSSNPEKKSFRKDINEINGIRSEIVKNIKRSFNEKIKVGWIFLTKNVILNESDTELCKSNEVFVLDDSKLMYYEKILKQVGPISKYQLLAEVFEGKGIDGLNTTIPAIKGKFGKRTFYSFAIEPEKLIPITFVAHRIKSKDEMESYQRILSKKRLADIREYILEDGLFPNSIILNFNVKDKKLKFEPISNKEHNSEARLGFLHLPAKYKSAWIIDGQHRLFGFFNTEKAKTATIPVLAFENLEDTEQARLFVDINSNQKNVQKNLLEELYSNLFWDSDDESEKMSALISRIVNHLGNDLDSPFYNKIKSSNEEIGKDKPITTATLTDSIRTLKLLGYIENKTEHLMPSALYSLKEPRMDNTLNRSKEILKKYFNLFKNGVPQNWNVGGHEGGYLCTNNGIVALLRIFKEIILHLEKSENLETRYLSEEELILKIEKYIQPVINYFKQAKPEDIRNYRKQQGKEGQKNCSLEMMELINKEFSEFKPEQLILRLSRKDSGYTEIVRNALPNLQIQIRDDILKTLKKEFGDKKTDWWSKGIPLSVRTQVQTRKEEEGGENEEEFFDFIHYSDIIYQNWELFKDKYSILNKGESGKARGLAWFKSLNNIRKKISHPERGLVTEEEYNLVIKVKETLEKKIKESNS